MIPLLIVWLIRKFKNAGNRKASILRLGKIVRQYAFRVIILGGVMILFSMALKAQTKMASYLIIRNGNIEGKLTFHQTVNGDSVCLKTESDIKTRFLISISVFSKEEAIYKNGILLFSSIYRRKNGTVKANKQIRLSGNEYIITAHGKTEVLKNYPIRNNLISLYYSEPKLFNTVYSDFFQQYVKLEKVGERKYRVSLPDGAYNYYYYENGICTGVEVHGSMFTAMLVLNR